MAWRPLGFEEEVFEYADSGAREDEGLEEEVRLEWGQSLEGLLRFGCFTHECEVGHVDGVGEGDVFGV